MAKDAEKASSESESSRVAFDYIKSNHFRILHADGAIGGVTPKGLLEMNLFSERLPIPKRTIHELAGDGTLGRELTEERTTRDAVIREIDVGVMMDLPTAKTLIVWLEAKVKQLESAVASTTDQ